MTRLAWLVGGRWNWEAHNARWWFLTGCQVGGGLMAIVAIILVLVVDR